MYGLYLDDESCRTCNTENLFWSLEEDESEETEVVGELHMKCEHCTDNYQVIRLYEERPREELIDILVGKLL